MSGFGQYVFGSSFIHKLDGRNKLFLTIIIVRTAFFSKTLLGLLPLFVASLILIYLSKISLNYFWKSIRFFVLMIFITAIFQMIFSRGVHVYFEIGFFAITSVGIHFAIMAIIRFFIAIIVTNFYFMTTPAIQIAGGISGLLKPLRVLKVPVEDITLVLSIAFRFVPTMTLEFQNIMDAQKSRGTSFTTGPIVKRIKSFIPMIIPLFLNTFRRAEDLASAMLMRRYTDGKNVTRMHQMLWSTTDTITLVTTFLICTSIIYRNLI